jgi:hypothetical protein
MAVGAPEPMLDLGDRGASGDMALALPFQLCEACSRWAGEQASYLQWRYETGEIETSASLPWIWEDRNLHHRLS